MAIRATILDWDGTTFNSWPQALRVIRKIFAQFGYQNDTEKETEIRRQWGYAAAEAFRSVLPEIDYELLRNAWVTKIQIAGDTETLNMVNGGQEALRELKRLDLKLTLLTNRKAKHLASNLPKSIDLTEFFSIVQTYHDYERNDQLFIDHPCHITCQHPKPDRRAYRPTLEQLKKDFGINTHEILTVDDSLVGLAVANANNMRFVGVLTGAINTKARWMRWAKERGLTITPEQIIPSIKYLPEWIEQYDK